MRPWEPGDGQERAGGGGPPPIGDLRPFVWEGKTYRLADEEATRARDLRDGTATFVAPDGSSVVVPPRYLEGGGDGPPVRHPEPIDLRTLVEDVLSAGFDDIWVYEILRFAGRHGLLRRPGNGS